MEATPIFDRVVNSRVTSATVRQMAARVRWRAAGASLPPIRQDTATAFTIRLDAAGAVDDLGLPFTIQEVDRAIQSVLEDWASREGCPVPADVDDELLYNLEEQILEQLGLEPGLLNETERVQ